MRPTRTPLLALGIATALSASAQFGGKAVFRVLDVPSSARIAALGGSPIAVLDNDINQKVA